MNEADIIDAFNLRLVTRVRRRAIEMASNRNEPLSDQHFTDAAEQLADALAGLLTKHGSNT